MSDPRWDPRLDDEGYVRQRLNDAERRIEKMVVALSDHGLDTLSLRVAHLVEDEFAHHHVGGRTQRLAKIQAIVREAIREATAGERKWDAWFPGGFGPVPDKPQGEDA